MQKISGRLVGAAELTNLELKKCAFEGCSVQATSASERPRFHAVQLEKCRARGVGLAGVIAEDVVIDGLLTSNMIIGWGLALRHVAIRGAVGSIKLNEEFSLGWSEEQRLANEAFRRANEAFYSDVDWALDISAMRAWNFEVSGIPARLIRRDPETQFLFLADHVRGSAWRDIAGETPLRFALAELESGAAREHVAVAGRRSRSFQQDLAVLRALRTARIAEPE